MNLLNVSVQSFYNLTCYNTDFDTTGSCCGSQIFVTMEFYEGIKGKSLSSSGFGQRSGAGAASTSVGPSPGNWLAAHTADITMGKTAICIFVAKFYGLMPFLSLTQTLLEVQKLCLYPTDFGCVLHR